MSVKNSEQGVAVTQVQRVDVSILVALPPTLHAASAVHESIVLAVLCILLGHRLRQKVPHFCYSSSIAS
jgi:hypothetical protein